MVGCTTPTGGTSFEAFKNCLCCLHPESAIDAYDTQCRMYMAEQGGFVANSIDCHLQGLSAIFSPERKIGGGDAGGGTRK